MFAWNILDQMPWSVDASGDTDPEIDIGRLFWSTEDLSKIFDAEFDVTEIDRRLRREYTAIADQLDELQGPVSPQWNEFDGYSEPRSKSDWLRILSKLGQPMGEDKFRELRKLGIFQEHESTVGKPAKWIRLKISTLPKGYSDEMKPG